MRKEGGMSRKNKEGGENSGRMYNAPADVCVLATCSVRSGEKL